MRNLLITETSRRRALAVLAATALLGSFSLGPAAALDRTVTDGQDEPAGVDITSVVYRNHERTAGAVVSVRDLHQKGRLVTRIGAPDSDAWYAATVRVASDGSLVARLRSVSDMGTHPVECDFDASWSAVDDTVTVRVPHSCLKFGFFMEREWFQSTMYHGSASDDAKGVDVGRGDSPGCATKDEMKGVHHGDKKFRVHQWLDTAGKYGDAGAGSYGRTYADCDGGAHWFVQYSIETHTVVNKGRVG